MGKKKNRHQYPPIALAPSPIIDNHCHLPVRMSEFPRVELGVGAGATEVDGAAGSHAAPVADGAAQADGAPAVGFAPGQIPPITSIREHLDAAAAAGVSHMITVGCEIPDFEPTIRLAREHAEIFAAIAIHPNEAALHAGALEKSPDGWTHEQADHHRAFSLDEAIAEVARQATEGLRAASPAESGSASPAGARPAVVAIGETGLDYFRTAEPGRQAQIEAFRAHIALAKELNLPLQIHDREAHDDVVATLLADGAPERTVFHCFSGGPKLAQICAENGWYASFAGPLTYPANEDLRAAFDELPDELILVETDSPYLTAHPFRGQPNAPFAVVWTALAMAERRGVSTDTWCENLRQRTIDVYQLPIGVN